MAAKLTLDECKKKFIGFHNRNLTIIDVFVKPRWNSKDGRYYNEKWALCKCDCGNEHSFRLSDVINDAVWSCGCLRNQAVTENIKKAREVYFDKYVYTRRGNTYIDFGNGVTQVDSHANPEIKFYVDTITWNWLKAFTWSVGSNGYVYTSSNYRPFAYHDIIIACPPGYVRDHIDRQRNNNLYQNLRVTTYRGNMINRDYSQIDASGNVKIAGVSFVENRWRVNIRTKERPLYEFYYTQEEAIQRRKELEQEYHIIEEVVPIPRLILSDGSLNYLNFRFDWYPKAYDAIWEFLGIKLVPFLNP